MIFEHKSVLLEETVDSLKIVPDGIYVDGTLGGGGHAARVLSRLGPSGRLVGIDQDEDAVRAATEHLNDYKDKVIIYNEQECLVHTIGGMDNFNGRFNDLALLLIPTDKSYEYVMVTPDSIDTIELK